MKEGKLILQLRNRLSELEGLGAELEAFGEAMELSPKTIYHMNLALDELLTNIISYGYADTAEHWIDISITLKKDILTIRFKDDGIPFNPLEVQEPDCHASLEERPIGGLGIHFIKHCMDDIVYERWKDNNILIMKKNVRQT